MLFRSVGVAVWGLLSVVSAYFGRQARKLTHLLRQMFALGVQVVVQGRLAASSTALLIFYLLKIVSNIYTVSMLHYPLHYPTLACLALALILTLAIFSLELVGPDPWTPTSKEGYTILPEDVNSLMRVSPLARANFFTKLYFGWLSPLLRLGLTKTLTKEDIYALPVSSFVTADFLL